MARKRKTYKRYSPLAFVNGFLSLAVVGLIVAFFFLPVFSYEAGGDLVTYNGQDFVIQCLRKFWPGTLDPKYEQFVYYFQEYIDIGGESFLLKPICQFHEWLELAMVAIFAIALILVVIEAILGILWLATGRLLATGSTKALGWVIFVFFGLTLGALIGYLFAYSEIIKGCGESIPFIFSFIPFFLLGGIFACSLAMSIIHAVGYRHRILYKKPKEAAQEAAPMMAAQLEPQPEPEPEVVEEPVVEEQLDEKEPEPEEENPEEEIAEEIDEEEPEEEVQEATNEEEEEPVKEEPPMPTEWECPGCGAHNTGKFCENCGSPRPNK